MSVGQVVRLETTGKSKTVRVVGEIDPDRAYVGRKGWLVGTEPREDDIFVSVSIDGAFATSAQFKALKRYNPVPGVFWDKDYKPMDDLVGFGRAAKGYWSIAVAFADDPVLDDKTQSVVRVLSVTQRRNGTLEMYDWTRVIEGKLKDPVRPGLWEGAPTAAALPKLPPAHWP